MAARWLFPRLAAAAIWSAAALAASATDAAGAAVEVLDLRGASVRACDAVDPSGRFVEGGCAERAYDFSTSISIRTAVGEMPFGDCTIASDVTFAADGRVWFDRIRIGGSTPCNDIRPCAPQSVWSELDDPYDALPLSGVLPWKGQIRAVGRDMALRLSVCFDTCAGRYRGPIEGRLVREGRGWVVRIVDAGVGDGGLVVSGEWELNPSRIDLRRARPAASADHRANAGSARDPVTRAIASLRSAFETGALGRACGVLTASARREAGAGRSCRVGLRELSDAIRAGAVAGTAPKVVRVRVSGGRAVAMLSLGGGVSARVRAVRHGDRWRLARFRLPLYADTPTTVHRARRGGIAVTASVRRGGRAVKCPPIDARDRFAIRGGCLGSALSADTSLTILTVAGAYELGGCALSWDVVVGRNGSTWMYDTTASGSEHCRKIEACFKRRGGGRKSPGLPIAGVIHGDGDSDGSVHDHVDLCLFTPLGAVRGLVTLRFHPARAPARQWIIEAERTSVGRGAFLLEGRWTLDLPGLHFREHLPEALLERFRGG